jgi:hypothetical protein
MGPWVGGFVFREIANANMQSFVDCYTSNIHVTSFFHRSDRDNHSKIQVSRALVYWTTPSGNQLIKYKIRLNHRLLTFDHSQLDLLLGALDRVGTVADVTANSEAEVTADRSL